MAARNGWFRNNLMTGIAVGAAVVVLGPILAPAVARMARPMAKTAMKAGLVAIERGRETIAELGEVAEDVLAEARAELAEEREVMAAAAAAGRGGRDFEEPEEDD
jgi:hypothetical protein